MGVNLALIIAAISASDTDGVCREVQARVYSVNNTNKEHQIIFSSDNPVHNVTIRLTATKDGPEAVAKISKITGAVG